MPRPFPILIVLLFTVLMSTTTMTAAAQHVKLSGLAYVDYSYVLDQPGAKAGDNGFGYRRLYLTGDYQVSDDLSVRARLETSDGVTNSAGRPSPFVKDLFVRWKNALGDGHELYLGIAAAPGWEVSEQFFCYRSLEATIMDRAKIASSRDFGVRASGPVVSGGKVRYNVMFANNNSVNRENDKFKRLYGQLEFRPTDRVTATLGGDYTARDGGSSYTANGFVGYTLEKVRFGVEGFLSPIRLDAPQTDTDRTGVSLMMAAGLTPALELVARYDTYTVDAGGSSDTGWYGLAGLAWKAEKGFQIIPNLVLDKGPAATDPMITGRVTMHVDF